ncbi:hypothetical protein BACCOPRO_02970 [Phocaeicola coprophilus DSM 18228 = JCM 13818]|uniref:Uncharacterized protein n=1 Tax=Phocaeicola coprophilus DSM 18228 = JCM 13818 TaxID=547042 RepID=S0FAH9_9BACT|nr:hypothetical protein BACCOPRO_02970 [Phocaeicola coprophilus DSM 18228 = JCM 13818]
MYQSLQHASRWKCAEVLYAFFTFCLLNLGIFALSSDSYV